MAKNYKNYEIMEVYWKVNPISLLILYLYWPVCHTKERKVKELTTGQYDNKIIGNSLVDLSLFLLSPDPMDGHF